MSPKKKNWGGSNTSYIPVFEYVKETSLEQRTLAFKVALQDIQSSKERAVQAKSAWQNDDGDEIAI